MRKNYIKVENIYLYDLANAEFINFMQRLRALLPIVKDEESRDAAPALAITADQVAELDGYLQTMNDLTRESQVKAETKPKKEIDRLRDFLHHRTGFALAFPASGRREQGGRATLHRGEAVLWRRKTAVQPGDGGDKRLPDGYEQDGKCGGGDYLGA